ncbi:MAG: hypothetical protein O3C61_07150, partial [Proteobacteria bacterium]|nr:hypothetical protein [Pseudomonadota bacterium]
MIIIEQLNKLPINKGEYLVLPNIDTPFFIIPMKSKGDFQKAIKFIKPKNKYGWIKKLVLRFLPFILIRLFFQTVKIATKITSAATQLILPWNQDFNNKFVIFNLGEKPSLIKIGFNNASKLIQNEHKVITEYFNDNEIFPNILKYQENEDFCILETTFYKGEHPTSLPNSIVDFFNTKYKDSTSVAFKDHPYIKKMMKLIFEKLENNKNIFRWLARYDSTFKDKQVLISLMHGDCTTTNIICEDERSKLIDWEECIEDGI